MSIAMELMKHGETNECTSYNMEKLMNVKL